MVPTPSSRSILLLHFLLLQTPVFHSLLTSGAAAYSNQTTTIPGSAPCLPHQAAILLMFRRDFAFRSNFFTSWQSGTDCCNWHGVGCDAGDGRVTSIDLAGMANLLPHGLSQSLFQLTSLKHLNLSNNDFDGKPLPTTGFERLTHLTHLNLSDTNIAGQIPASIGQLKNLVSLDLSTSVSVEIYEYHNDEYLLGLGAIFMPELRKPNLAGLLANLSSLRELRLGYVDLSNVGTKWCDALAEHAPKLEVLSLPFCSLSGSICTSLSRLRSLSVIDLQYNNLNGSVPDFLADLPSLNFLRLSSNDFEGWFPPRILQHKRLDTLEVRNNTRLCGNFSVIFPKESSLRNLVVRMTNFSGGIPSSISNLKSLESLDLAATGFSGELPSSISELEALNALAISGFGLAGSIPSWITNLSSITVLEFSNCGLSGPIPPYLLCSLNYLETLVLNNCNFSGAIPIPSSCIPNNSSQLSTIVFRSNSFAGPVELGSFWNLTYLEYLDLSNNRLIVVDRNGNFSTNSLPQIRHLLLASCNLSAFPSALRYLYQIQVLDLSDNQISGAIPKWVWEPWDQLKVLNLSRNLLTHAELFHTVLPFSWLSTLDLSFNLFKGAILVPTSYSLILDYSNNNFSSIEPSSVAYLCNAYVLKVSRNNLSGVISPSLCCAAKSLKILDLSYNNLSGSIPSCLIEEADALRILSLRANMFHGGFPVQHNTSKRCDLEFVDINDNSISGQLPRSLSACKNLEMLDVGNNHMLDSFPCWLSTLPRLQVLVLKSNNFFGHVGGQSSNCGFSGLRIFDLASNNFSGPLQDQWLTTFRSMIVKPDSEPSVAMGDQNLAYQFTVTLTLKGVVGITITKISNELVLMDFSGNALQGSIPEAIGNLVRLRGLNMSRNTFTGLIPSQFSSLDQLEALDLSWNQLTGRIPQELVSLDFLQILNLSYNELVGKIPDSPHFLTFPSDYFLGNPGLCGSQLFTPCVNKTVGPSSNEGSRTDIDIFLFLFIGVGFGIGLAIVIVLRWGFHIKQ